MADRKDVGQEIDALVERYLETGREDLRDLVIVQCAGLVERIARRFSGIEPAEDLAQVGYIGLLNALSKFDQTAGVKFTTYATYLVAGEIKHYLRDRAQTIRQPAWLQELRHKVNKTAAGLQSEYGRVPSDREIAEKLSISETAVREVFQTQDMLRVASLDATPQGDDDSESDLEKLDASAFCPDQLSVEDRLVLEHAMRQLRDLEREVLHHFHFESMNQTEIANKLGISCNYVSHILRQSLAKLRKILVNEEEKDRILRRQGETIDYDVLDPMTTAYTENFFKSRLEEEIHRALSGASAVGVVVVEFKGLDKLRQFYGTGSVDDFLIDAAGFFRDSVRRLDLVCRYGEHGFGLILPASDDNVLLVRDRLLAKIQRWMKMRGGASPVQVRVSHACAPTHGRSGRELLNSLEAVDFGEAIAA